MAGEQAPALAGQKLGLIGNHLDEQCIFYHPLFSFILQEKG